MSQLLVVQACQQHMYWELPPSGTPAVGCAVAEGPCNRQPQTRTSRMPVTRWAGAAELLSEQRQRAKSADSAMESMESQGPAAEVSSHMADGDMGSASLDGDSDAGGAYDQAEDFGDGGGHDDQDAGFNGPADQGGSSQYDSCVAAELRVNHCAP